MKYLIKTTVWGLRIITLFIFNISSLLSSTIAQNPYYNPTEYEYLIKEEPRSEDYEVWINDTKAIVYMARVQDPPFNKEKTKLDFGGDYSFVTFDLSEPTEVKIYSKNIIENNAIFRPDDLNVKILENNNHVIRFIIDKPIKISIEPDGKNRPLLLFANPTNKFVLDKNDTNLIYFGPGIYRPDSAIINLGNNQILYLAEGSIVKAGIRVRGDNVTICGRGIICGNEFVRGGFSRNLISLEGCNNIVVKDIILRGGAIWTMPLRNSKNILIDNIKILGGRSQGDDGINPVNSSDILIKNCFIRTDDDCLAFKGSQLYKQEVRNITVENSILWGDRSRIILLGHESQAKYMHNIVFRNIDILHFGGAAFVLEPGENMKLQNILFENIRINGEGQKNFIRIRPTINKYMHNKVPGYINEITFNNIVVSGEDGSYKIRIRGADEKHNINKVEFLKTYIMNNLVTQESDYLEVGDFVFNLYIK